MRGFEVIILSLLPVVIDFDYTKLIKIIIPIATVISKNKGVILPWTAQMKDASFFITSIFMITSIVNYLNRDYQQLKIIGVDIHYIVHFLLFMASLVIKEYVLAITVIVNLVIHYLVNIYKKDFDARFL